MTLPAIPQPIQVQEVADHSARLAELERALKKLRWRKLEGDELLADRIEGEIRRLKLYQTSRR